eukprot:CAMPEP_0183548724 /NCGR_PEP_ID=MMETSP0371-20130417/60841_1 /TAXON_ID=268820 /ORGANISM="Peridinium aciculiferum, Strain PAER-2" /LENGTH=106 /DNA_ID=CAMNT_0025752199 /DNA_START=123 /DNA_END=441 /DNA_ORIENTATION=-
MRRDSTVRKFYRAIAAIMHSMHWTRDPIQKRLDAPRATIKSRRVGATKRVRRAQQRLAGNFLPKATGAHAREGTFALSNSVPVHQNLLRDVMYMSEPRARKVKPKN